MSAIDSAERFLVAARRRRDARIIIGGEGLQEWAAELAALTEFGDAREAVAAEGGRPLTPEALLETGLAGLAAAHEDDSDLRLAAEQLIRHLTRSAMKCFDAVALDIDSRRLPQGVSIGEWTTWTPDAEALAELAPVPIAARYLRWDPWPAPVVTKHALLLRRDIDRDPDGMWFRFPRGRREFDHWLPLLVLNLYSTWVVKAPAVFDIYEGERVQRHGDGVFAEEEPTQGPDGEIDGWYLRLYTGNFRVAPGDEDRFHRFCQAVADGITRLSNEPKTDQLGARLERAAKQFVLANADSWPDATVDDDTQPDVALRYTIALEALLADATQELRRMVAQRAAVLLADNESAAAETFRTISHAYDQRSRYVHGGQPKSVDTKDLREVVRKTFLRWVAVGLAWSERAAESPIGKDRVNTAFFQCLDDALVVPQLRLAHVDGPIKAFARHLS